MPEERWTIFTRAVGKEGEGIDLKLIDAHGDADLVEVEKTVRDAFKKIFHGEPQQVGAARLPFWEEADGNEPDA